MIVKQNQHMVFGALDLKIDMAEKRTRSLKSRASSSEETEAALREKIAILEKEIRIIRAHRASSPSLLECAEKEVVSLHRVRTACETDPRVADAVWMKLLLDRKDKKSFR